MSPDLTIILVSYNTEVLISRALSSVVEHQAQLVVQVILVDNASCDGTVERVSREFPSVSVIESSKNLGFGAACNLAAEQATAEFILLLNPDTIVLEGTLSNAIGFARERPENGIYGGRTLNEDGSLNPNSCWGKPTLWSVFSAAVGLTVLFPRSRWFAPESLGAWKRNTARQVDIVAGCFLLTTRELWRRMGGFDELFFMYSEDADLCIRARELGLRPIINPEAELIHIGGGSEPVKADKLVRLMRGRRQLIRKHWGPTTAYLGCLLLLLHVLLRAYMGRILSALRLGSSDSMSAWEAVWLHRGEWAAHEVGSRDVHHG